MTKYCTKCKSTKLVTEFSKNKIKKDGLQTYCKTCLAIYRDRWFQNNKERIRKVNRNGHLKRMYGLTLVEYTELHEKQLGLCAICKKQPSHENLVVDHSHSTGVVRGLLCLQCNAALGLFKESKDILRQAIDYLDI